MHIYNIQQSICTSVEVILSDALHLVEQVAVEFLPDFSMAIFVFGQYMDRLNGIVDYTKPVLIYRKGEDIEVFDEYSLYSDKLIKLVGNVEAKYVNRQDIVFPEDYCYEYLTPDFN